MIDEAGQPIIDPDNGWKTPEQGAGTIIWAATSPLLNDIGGVYCANCNVGPQLPEGAQRTLAGVSAAATDPVNAGRLWELAEQLTGARID